MKKELLNTISKSEKLIPVTYYLDTGIIITENNIQFIIEAELIEFENKLKVSENPEIFSPYKNSIIERIKSNLNKPYLELKYAFFNRNNYNEYKEIESLENFHSWV
jgi:hypothetical protein